MSNFQCQIRIHLFTPLSFLFVLTLSLAACSFSKKGLPAPTPAIPALMNTSQILEKVKPSDVPFQLYKVQAIDPANVNFSPLSLKLAFSLIYPGTSGATQKTLEKIFGFSETTPIIGAAELALAKAVESKKDESNQLLIESSVWMKDLKSINPIYKAALKEQEADLFKLSAKEMNDWVSKVTRGKISKIVSVIDPRAQIIFINAIYFKAPWLKGFDKKKTSIQLFQASSHLSLNVPTLHSDEKLSYFEDDFSKWIELPYRDSEFVMRIALPKKRFDLRKVEDELSADYLSKVVAGFKPTGVNLSLPKFKFEQHLSFRNVLDRAGYGDLFTSDPSNLAKISKSNDTEISDVVQATTIVVDEVGTEAAAATGIVMESALRTLNKDFNADQPFLFILQNKKSGEIYFMGRVSDPTKTG